MPHQPLTFDEAVLQVTKIVKKQPCSYTLVPFPKFNQVHKLRSAKYKPFLVLCPANTLQSAGYLVCKFVLTGGCKIRGALLRFHSSAGGTGRLDRHMSLHKQSSPLSLTRSLPLGARKEINKAAALAVALDHRPISFSHKKPGMTALAKALFQAGQSVAANDSISPESLLPSAGTVKTEITALAKELRQNFKTGIIEKLLASGGGISTDGVTLTVQDRQYYDLTVHVLEIGPVVSFQKPAKIAMMSRTLLLREKPDVGTAVNLRGMLDEALKEVYGCSLDKLTTTFTMVTDCASVMARVAGSSVSSRVADKDPKWLGCGAHKLNSAMKSCFTSLRSSESDVLKRIYEDVGRVKTIVRLFKQGGWNSKLPNGYHLIQEAETRFATTYTVVTRFLKSVHLVETIIEEKDNANARSALEGLLTDRNSEGDIQGYPALEALLDSFAFIVDAQTRFQAADYPTIHMALPLLQRCYDELRRVSNGGCVQRSGRRGAIPPPMHSKLLCEEMVEWLDAKVRVHDLWLAGCFLNPFTREFQFVPNMERRTRFMERAERVCRLLLDKGNENDNNSTASGNSTATEALSLPRPATSDSEGRCDFDLASYADSHFGSHTVSDEVSKYNALEVWSLGYNVNDFSNDPFASIRFWHKHKASFPGLFAVARRVFATPVTSCSSERVFSAVNRIVSRDRASMNPTTLEDIIVIRSLS